MPSPNGMGLFEFVAYVQNNPDWGKDHKKTKDGTCRFTSREVFTINPTGKNVYNNDESDRVKYGQLLLNADEFRSLDTQSPGYNPYPNTRGNMNNLRFELDNIGTPHAVQSGNSQR